MQSDFAAARLCLERAHSMMKGEDPRSGMLREAIELLVEAVITAEHSQAAAAGKVVPFPSRQAS
jgi:hypothetical protein